MKKIHILLLIILVIILLIISFFIFRKSFSISSTPKKNTPEVEKLIFLNQSDLFVSMFSTREDPEGATLEDKQMAHIIINPSISITAIEPIKSLTITKVKFTSNIGTPLFIHPSNEVMGSIQTYILTSSNTDIRASDIKGGGNTIKYDIVSSNATKFNEVLTGGGIPRFNFIVKDLGTVSEQTILNTNKIYEGAKILNYLNIKAEQLDAKIAFDLKIVFDNGKEYYKRFSADIDGAKVLSGDFYTIKMEAN
ncbi:hypothetical protein M0R04_00285 [Candidatus Dojkabacteria bacterium]|jgi:hypothetical protein|nr:hypothetical protein [Candidatus Dojkabacteria bacterium]